MGIRGLTSFILQNPEFWKPFKLHDSTVIIDGCSLYHHLYRDDKLDYIYGGEYQKYSDSIRQFMSNFHECNIKPMVIIDGGYGNSDRNTILLIERGNNTIKNKVLPINRCIESSQPVFPLLAFEVFYFVLRDLGVSFAVSDYSADNEVAALGNYYNCPVISNHSDFYLFETHSFIHLDSVDTKVSLEIDSGRNEKFIYCKIYNIDQFVIHFPGLDKNILPLFGTLIGNDFVPPNTFIKFFSNVKLPENKSRKICFESKHQKKILGLLCWLQRKSVNEAVNEIMTYFEEGRQKNIKSVIENSIHGYRLSPCNLSLLLDSRIDEFQNQLNKSSRLITPCGNSLPKNIAMKFHQGYLTRFFFNVIGMHKVFLMPQIDNLNLSSSHECTSRIRQVMYGILVRHDINGTECSNRECMGFIEEFDRKGMHMKKKKVLPCFSMEGIGLLPKINEVHDIHKEKCISIISKTLGIHSDFFFGIPDEWQLFIAGINYLLRNSSCISQDFVSAVTLNLIYFGLIKCKNMFINQAPCPKKITDPKCTCTCITCIAVNVGESDLQHVGNMLEKYYNDSPCNSDQYFYLNFTHSFSQLKSCISHTILLSSLLNDCLKRPNPAKCFSGTMLFNLTNVISSEQNPKFIFESLLGKDVNVNALFTQLKSKMYQISVFREIKYIVNTQTQEVIDINVKI